MHDWDSTDVKYALAKAGTNLTKLARENNLAPSTVRNVFRQNSYPKIEKIIAQALNKKPEEIWPSRYAQ
jgi:Ner family transcriptional regulator